MSLNVTVAGGGSVTPNTQVLTDAFGRANAELVYGQRISGGAFDGVELALDVFGGEAAQSNRIYDDKLGSSYPMRWSKHAP